MSEIHNPRELFLHELGDILYLERSLADEALPGCRSRSRSERAPATAKPLR